MSRKIQDKTNKRNTEAAEENRRKRNTKAAEGSAANAGTPSTPAAASSAQSAVSFPKTQSPNAQNPVAIEGNPVPSNAQSAAQLARTQPNSKTPGGAKGQSAAQQLQFDRVNSETSGAAKSAKAANDLPDAISQTVSGLKAMKEAMSACSTAFGFVGTALEALKPGLRADTSKERVLAMATPGKSKNEREQFRQKELNPAVEAMFQQSGKLGTREEHFSLVEAFQKSGLTLDQIKPMEPSVMQLAKVSGLDPEAMGAILAKSIRDAKIKPEEVPGLMNSMLVSQKLGYGNTIENFLHMLPARAAYPKDGSPHPSTKEAYVAYLAARETGSGDDPAQTSAAVMQWIANPGNAEIARAGDAAREKGKHPYDAMRDTANAIIAADGQLAALEKQYDAAEPTENSNLYTLKEERRAALWAEIIPETEMRSAIAPVLKSSYTTAGVYENLNRFPNEIQNDASLYSNSNANVWDQGKSALTAASGIALDTVRLTADNVELIAPTGVSFLFKLLQFSKAQEGNGAPHQSSGLNVLNGVNEFLAAAGNVLRQGRNIQGENAAAYPETGSNASLWLTPPLKEMFNVSPTLFTPQQQDETPIPAEHSTNGTQASSLYPPLTSNAAATLSAFQGEPGAFGSGAFGPASLGQQGGQGWQTAALPAPEVNNTIEVAVTVQLDQWEIASRIKDIVIAETDRSFQGGISQV